MTPAPFPPGIAREVRSGIRQLRGARSVLYGAASRAEAHTPKRAALLWLAVRALNLAESLTSQALFGAVTTTTSKSTAEEAA